MSRIDASTTAVGGIIQLYKYEPFSNRFAIDASYILSDILTSSGTGADILGYISSNVSSTILTFASSNGPNASVSGVPLVVNDICSGTTRETLRYTVNIGAGRFTQPPLGKSYSLYKNEPVFFNDTLAARTFIASIPISQPTTIPTLPTGLVFDGSGTTYNLSGTPILQSPARDYTIIGKGSTDPSKVVSTTIRISVGAERLVVDLSGSKTITDLTVGTPIVSRALFGRCPPYPLAGSNVIYTWTAVPDGLYFTNVSGVPVYSPYLATDASSTLVLTGTPTLNAARSITEPFTTTVTATRKSLPTIVSNVQYSFGFVETVLFDALGYFSNQYVNANVRLSNSSNIFRAYTRFGSTSNALIRDISTTTLLPADLSTTFVSSGQYAYIAGKPTGTSSATYTMRAINSNNVVGLISFDLTVVNDIVTFTSSDVCATFIVDRALSNAKDGYYDYPIQFTANSAAGCNVTYSAVGLPNGIVLSSNGILSGTPSTSSSLTTYTVTGTASDTSATNTKTFLASVLPEKFTWVPQTLSFVQNIPITPVQFRATTLSERLVVSYSSTTQPRGLTVPSSGLMFGTPLQDGSGTMFVRGTTGLVADICAYPFSVRRDQIVLYTQSPEYSITPGQVLNIPVQSVAYSGNVVSNFQFSNLDPSFGIVINSTTGVISGTVTSNVYYIQDCNIFTIKGSVADASGTLGARIQTTNPYRPRYFAGQLDPSSNFETRYSDRSPYAWDASMALIAQSNLGGGNDFQNANGVFLTPVVGAGLLYRSTNGQLFSNVFGSNVKEFPCVSAVANKTGTSTWWGIGIRNDNDGDPERRNPIPVLFTSTDDGITWDTETAPKIEGFFTRDSNFSNNSSIYGVTDVSRNAYLRAGAAIAYKNGVLMIGGLSNGGGPSLFRSTDYGCNWAYINTGFSNETAFINTDHSNIWVMTGSDRYISSDSSSNPFDFNTTTIRYSTDQGETWSPASGDFNMHGYNLTYACNTWMATGLDCSLSGTDNYYVPSARVSTDGSNWSPVYVPHDESIYRYVPPLPFSPYSFDGSWNTLTTDSRTGSVYLYYHDAGVNPFNDSNYWGIGNVSTLFTTGSRFTYFTNPIYATSSTATAVLSFPNVGAGPIITSPATYYTMYQFVTHPPIVFSSTDPQATFFVSGLPVGFAFDPLTNTLNATPSDLGLTSFQVTAINVTGGVTTQTVQINVVIPRVIRVQSNAGGYTSLLRQYVTVNAAQNSRDTRVLPGAPLGEFMAPPAPDNISDIICCPPN